MTKTHRDSYYEAYYFFELHEDFLQVHQSVGSIPYPAVLKNDGERFYFHEICELVFFKDIDVIEEGSIGDEDTSAYVYSCKIKSKKGSKIKIRSLISWEGRNKKHQSEAYYRFINSLLEKVQQYQPKLCISSGMLSRIDRFIPALKIGGISVAGVSVFSALASSLIEMGEYVSVFFDVSYAGFLGMFAVGALFGIAKVSFNIAKKEVLLTKIEQEYLPILN